MPSIRQQTALRVEWTDDGAGNAITSGHLRQFWCRVDRVDWMHFVIESSSFTLLMVGGNCCPVCGVLTGCINYKI